MNTNDYIQEIIIARIMSKGKFNYWPAFLQNTFVLKPSDIIVKYYSC